MGWGGVGWGGVGWGGVGWGGVGWGGVGWGGVGGVGWGGVGWGGGDVSSSGPHRVVLQFHYEVGEVGLDACEVKLEHIEPVAADVERQQSVQEAQVH